MRSAVNVLASPPPHLSVVVFPTWDSISASTYGGGGSVDVSYTPLKETSVFRAPSLLKRQSLEIIFAN
jgi:hypothetical protein